MVVIRKVCSECKTIFYVREKFHFFKFCARCYEKKIYKNTKKRNLIEYNQITNYFGLKTKK